MYICRAGSTAGKLLSSSTLECYTLCQKVRPAGSREQGPGGLARRRCSAPLAPFTSPCTPCCHVAQAGARIISASYGSADFSSFEYDAIEAMQATVLFVAAAGNGVLVGAAWGAVVLASAAAKAVCRSAALLTSAGALLASPCRGHQLRCEPGAALSRHVLSAQHHLRWVPPAAWPPLLHSLGMKKLASGQRLTPCCPSPATRPPLRAVAASRPDDQLASFSNYGFNGVHLAAPGVQILSTSYRGDAAFERMSGTSQATPLVAGAAALLLSAAPAESIDQVR
jgi:subtilisin family serine protease